MRERKSVSTQILLQDLGIFLYTAACGVGGIITALAGNDLIVQNLLLMMLMVLIAMLAAMRAKSASVIVCSISILFFCIYKLYGYIAYDAAIEGTAYLWPPLLLTALGGMTLFVSLTSRIEMVNSLLNRRIDELTVLDPLTGLENMRSMVGALTRYMSLSERKGTEMGIMLIRLRYAAEVQKVLTTDQFNTLRQSLARVAENTLRAEDRVFTMDEKGSLGILYFSPEEGVSFIKGRLLAAIEKAELLPDMNERFLRVDLSIVHMQYDKRYGKDAMKYIADTEREFAYEV